ncbi:hypothetical protein B0H19DRAFT_1084593 [Mycena capillaripes]|nr:hypothetical protein B0H19DRAFT_1084593 [Mycena capillaripes]
MERMGGSKGEEEKNEDWEGAAHEDVAVKQERKRLALAQNRNGRSGFYCPHPRATTHPSRWPSEQCRLLLGSTRPDVPERRLYSRPVIASETVAKKQLHGGGQCPTGDLSAEHEKIAKIAPQLEVCVKHGWLMYLPRHETRQRIRNFLWNLR